MGSKIKVLFYCVFAAFLSFFLVIADGTFVPMARADQVRDMQYWLDEYGFRDAWTVTKGKGVTVAVIDTGIDSSIPELQNVVIGGTDVSGNGASNGQKPIGSRKQHGTLVASVLAGRGKGVGNSVIGVAPEANLLSISLAFEPNTDNDDQIAKAVRWAVDNGAKVINMSLTRNTLDWPQSWDDAFLYAFSHDVVVVAAAGNRADGTTEVGAPATIPGVLTVAGVDRKGRASSNSSSQGITISVAAPSEELVGIAPGGNVYQWSGTSAATPIVSGLVALVRSAFPHLDAANVIKRVIATANPDGHDVPSPLYGNGLIDARSAVTNNVSAASDSPEKLLTEWIRVHRRAVYPKTSDKKASAAALVPKADPSPVQKNSVIGFVANPWLERNVFIPIFFLLLFAILTTFLALALTRHFRRTSLE